MSDRRRFNIDDLFTDTSPRAIGVRDLVEAKEIQLDRIEPDPEQPRTDFNADGLEELAASIKAEGVLQPLAVRYDELRDIYVIVHGERRWRAAGMAGLTSIPAIVRDVPEERRLVQQLMENIVREDLNALDRAAALRALKIQMNDAPWEQVAIAVGIRRSRLFQLLGTKKLSPALQDALRQNVVSEKQTRSLQQLPEPIQEEVGWRVIRGELAPNMLALVGKSLRGVESPSEAVMLLERFKEHESATKQHDVLLRSIRRRARSARVSLDEFLAAGSRVQLPSATRAELERLERRIRLALDR